MRYVVRYGVALAATSVGTLFAVACLIAAHFELQGFGRARDTEPRPLYLVGLTLAFAVCVAVPTALWRRLRRNRAAAAAVVVVAAASLLGLRLTA